MKTKRKNAGLAKLVLSMFIFGSVGILRRYIPLSSEVIAFARGVIGMLFLLVMLLLSGKKRRGNIGRRELGLLFASGVCLGFNWIFLFEAYTYTTVPTATLCYYMAPTFVMFAAPFVLKEKLTLPRVLCAVISLVGMVLVSGVLTSHETGKTDPRGILLGLAAAVLYAAVVLLNKRMRQVEADERTVVQLGVVAVILLPYTLLTGGLAQGFDVIRSEPLALFLLVIVGVLHTGIAYLLYFSAVGDVKAQTAAVFSYLDPVLALILSAIVLDEGLTVSGVLGAVLVLGGALAGELADAGRQKKKE